MILNNSYLERMRYRDPETLKHWENHIVKPSFVYAVMILGYEQDALDVCQETQIVMLDKIKYNEARHIISPKAFAIKTARNKSYDILKYRARVSELLPIYWEYTQAHLGQHYEEIMTMPTGKLLELLDKLTGQQRQAIYLSFIEGLSKEKVAEIMKIEPVTVRGHIAKALKSLRRMIASIANESFTSDP
ncbi:MAG: sigma-70 family RNA polymerase sigma factor [Phycisphaerae bacterium]|nr:sigma-70 family RNA polymerase sigma factor [Phycisphaerae bacterium]